MRLPQTITIHFEPIDNGNLADIEITTEYPCEQLDILRFLEWAVESLGAGMIKEGIDRLKDLE